MAKREGTAESINLGNSKYAVQTGRPNPVQVAFEQELSRFVKYMTRKAELGTRWEKADEEAFARGSNTLFNLWNNYESRLQQNYFIKTLIATGDFLLGIKEYKIAQYQCYGRYLSTIRPTNTTIESCADSDLESLKSIYFPKGLGDAYNPIVLRALLGETICSFHVTVAEDVKLKNPRTAAKSVTALKILRMITQIALHKETLCWLVFNGTVHIYTICRHLMALGYSKMVLEFLLWACMCMESSVPLMTVRYLSWRCTLYTAVCQCYYDLKALPQAEAFAKRAVTKVNELEDIEKISTSETTSISVGTFREAKAKMQIMVFKRVVFETRKRPKGLLRPKTKPNLKDSIHQPWPRTPAERLLADVFQTSTSAQFLAILEALNDPRRRTLHCEPPPIDTEDTMTDVYGELFFAGLEIIAGGGGSKHQHAMKHDADIHPSVLQLANSKLIGLVRDGASGVPLQSVVKFVKYAFNYEQWDTFNCLVHQTLELLKKQETSASLLDIKTLELMLAIEPFYSNIKKPKKAASQCAVDESNDQQTHQGKTNSPADDLMPLADTLHSCSVEPFKSIVGHMDPDMIIDAALFLWSKCKMQFQRVVSASMEGCKFVLNDKDCNKWIYQITVVHTALSWSDACTFDPILFAEVALKLSLVLECKASQNGNQLTKVEGQTIQETSNTDTKHDIPDKQQHQKQANAEASDKLQAERSQTSCSSSSKYSCILGLSDEGYSHGVTGLLAKSCDVLYQAFEGVGRARDARIQATGNDIVDVTLIKNAVSDSKDLTDTMVKALHMELLFVHHRLAVKLGELGQDPESRMSQKKLKLDRSKDSVASFKVDDNDLMSSCDKNPLSKALFLMHKAGCVVSTKGITGSEQQTQLMKESIELIQKVQQQDQKLLKWNKESVSAGDIPPPPVLLHRSPTIMVFKPSPFKPKNDKVAWYSLFARSANGNNIKVRLNDYQLLGTGEETPATSDCLLAVKGLKPNQRYVFAVAAYNSKGQLIGKSIGSSSRPILAAHSLPTLMAWGYLAQIAYTACVPSIAQQACAVLWNYFVIEPQPSEEELKIEKAGNDFKVRLKLIDEEKMHSCSPVLVRQFLQTIFIAVDLSIRENFLYCNSLCDNGPLYNIQVARLHECERLILAIHVAGWLNDTAMCLQAIVQVYGLLAPIIQQKIPAKPVIQVLLRCHAVLQEVPSLTRHRRQSSASDSLSHMIAAMTYFVAKTLQSWGENRLCGAIVELGKKMLNIETAPDSAGTMASMHQAAAIATANMVGQPLPKTKKKPKPKHKGVRKGMDKDFNNLHDGHDEELKSLEAYMMKLSQKALNREDDDLTGSEDPIILHSFVSSLPASEAYKEVLKFKRRTRFLEFFVQVLGKAIDEGLIETSLTWSNDAMTWVIRRNEMLLANKPTIVRIGTTGVGQEDEKIKRFATAIVEFGKSTAKPQTTRHGEAKEVETDEVRVRTKQETAKPPASKNTAKNVKSSIMSRKTGKLKGQNEEEINLNLAKEKLQTVLPDYWRSCNRRKKLRSVNKEELPWKVQLNVLTAGCNLELFLEKLGCLQRFTEDGENPMYGPLFMDPDWFSFSMSGTLITSWMGTSRRDSPEPPMGFSGSVMESSPYASPAVTTGHSTRTQRRVSQSVTERVRAGSRITAVSDKEGQPVPKSPLVYLGNVFSNLTRAIVLAHRGKYWTMMQNACRYLCNATDTILIRVMSGSLRLTDDPQGETKSDIDILRGALWRPFYIASDCMMDMMVQLQEDIQLDAHLNKKHDKIKKGDPEINEVSGLMGGVEDQKGGSSLLFEIPLDNTDILDTRWVKRLVLYAAEMMFYEAKWERVVEIILRFNALTRSRYAEAVLPMLIVSQRKLAERVEQNGGLSKSQPVIIVSKETGIAEEFVIIPDEYERIEPAVHLDPVGHNVYTGSIDALRLISVPMDINDSLNTLRQALDIKHHTARALEHSRQLLLCYLAGQQKGGSSHKLVRRGSSRVGFMPDQVKPPSDVPVDLTQEVFENVEDIRSYTLQPSQLAVVISSYDKTIEMLQFRQKRGLAAQAMHELGNIMFHSGNIRTAYKWWAEALDTILKTHDYLKTWRDIATEQDLSQSEALLKRCGLWGCLLAAVLAANIAQYVHTSNLGLRQECCLLSTALFKTLFCSTLPHPTADKDYALYEIGSGHEVKELIPGVDLLSDVFRSDGRSVVAVLRWVTEELIRARHLLTVLPLITLCLYFTSHVCRDVQRTADVRVLRVRVLTDLGLFSQAISVLSQLLRGERLPRTSTDGYVIEKKVNVDFSNAKPITDSNNVEVVNELLEHCLPDNLVSVYGDYIIARVNIVHAHLLVALATKVYAIPENMLDEIERFFVEKAEAEAAEAERPPTPMVPSTILAVSKKLGRARKSDEVSSERSLTGFHRKLISTETCPESLKGLLLGKAERILKGIDVSILQQLSLEDMEAEEEISYNLSPCDLELLVYTKLELCQISLERHQAVTAAMAVYTAMRAMEDAAVLNELGAEKRSPSMTNTSPLRPMSPSLLADHYLQSRERLDARLWLTCRLALSKCLSQEDSGMGKLGGLARSITAQIGSCEHHCRQGLDEAEAFGDIEIAAEFAMLDFVYSLQYGKISDELISKLEDVIIRLERCQTLSYTGQSLLALAVIQYGDINKQGSYCNDLNHISVPTVAYKQAASIVLKQMVNLGEYVDRTNKAPVLPLKDIYLQQIVVLAELKLRLGRAFARGSLDQNGNRSQNLTNSVKELELGLSLMRNAAFQSPPIEAQLLLSLGQVQRQMFNAGLVPVVTVTDTLIDAIKQTFSSDHDLGIMKQAYLEMAVTYLSNMKKAKETDELQTAAEVTEQQKTTKPDKREPKQKPKKSKEDKEKLKEIEKENRSAWIVIRSASLVSMAQHQIGLMTGDPEISALKISKKSGQLIPEFALIDLLGTDDVIPSENNSLVGKNGVVTMATTVNDTDVVQITWIHLLGYLSLLRRQRSYKALGVSPVNENGLGSMSLALSPLFSDSKAQKLSTVHDFLKNKLNPYASDCCGVFPEESLSFSIKPIKTDLDTKTTKGAAKAMVNRVSPLNAKEFELSVYWGKLEIDATSQDNSDDTIVLIYALNSKAMPSAGVASNLKTGLCCVPLARVKALHEDLMSTLELAENDLQPTSQASTPTAKTSKSDLSVPQGPQDNKGTPTGGRKKRSMGIRALSAKQRRDDTIRAKLKQHILEISDMLGVPKDTIPQDVPFEVTLRNVICLEAMFDPSRGFTAKATEPFYNWFTSVVQGY